MPELVVIAEQLFAAVPGGTGRYTEQLLPALATTAPAGWTVSSVVCRHPDASRAQVDGVRGPRVLPLPRRALVALWQAGVRYWPAGREAAGVHAPTPFAPPFVPRGARLSVTVHDTVPWTHPETLTARGVRWHRSTIGRAARVADALVVPTQAVAKDLATRVEGLAPLVVIPHAAAAVFGIPQARATATPPEYLLAVGTLEPRKGIDVLIAAAAHLHAAGRPAPPVLLAGPVGWGGLDPRELAVRSGLPDGAVEVLGRLPDAELAAVVQGAAAVVVPSLAEGFGLPVLEAMSAGVPVVHSDAAALLEVAGDAGVPVPRGDAEALAAALADLLPDQARRTALAAAGRRRAAEFSWQEAAEAVWRLHTDGRH